MIQEWLDQGKWVLSRSLLVEELLPEVEQWDYLP